MRSRAGTARASSTDLTTLPSTTSSRDKTRKRKHKKTSMLPIFIVFTFVATVIIAFTSWINAPRKQILDSSFEEGQGLVPTSQKKIDNSRLLVDLPENSIYRLSVPDIHGISTSLLPYAGFVTLVVNVACE
mmetsp:Transcript_15449/g.22785  ORF Transcript_15449/g.22785 Transcript_15449/m.22785 type:complete len:131 (+) Transcript_15449:156-548(+)